MARERRYLKGDVVECVEYPNPAEIGERWRVVMQQLHNGVIGLYHADSRGAHMGRLYAHQVKLVKRPWWNWLRLPFVKKVKAYKRSTVK